MASAEVVFRNIEKKMIKAIDMSLEELEKTLVKYAKDNHFYKNRTGNLSSNNFAKAIKQKLTLSNRTPYAKYVHNDPYNDNWLERAINENMDLIKRTIKNNISKET